VQLLLHPKRRARFPDRTYPDDNHSQKESLADCGTHLAWLNPSRNVRVISSHEKAQGNAPSLRIFSTPLIFSVQALWRKNQQEQLDFLAAARGPDIVAIEQDKSTSFILDTSPPPPRSSRLDRPMKSLSALAPHPDAEAAAKIFSAGESAASRFFVPCSRPAACARLCCHGRPHSHNSRRQASRPQQQVRRAAMRSCFWFSRIFVRYLQKRALTHDSEAKVLARIQKAVSRSPSAASASTAAADGRVTLPTKFKIPTAAPTSKSKAKCFDLWDKPIESFTDTSKIENLSRLPRGITSGTISQAAPPLKSSHTAARIPHPGASYRPSQDAHQVCGVLDFDALALCLLGVSCVDVCWRRFLISVFIFVSLRWIGSHRHCRISRNCQTRIC
jgi:hypothetical protein